MYTRDPRLLPGGAAGLLWRDWAIAPGVAVCDAKGKGFTYTLGFRKQPQVSGSCQPCHTGFCLLRALGLETKLFLPTHSARMC